MSDVKYSYYQTSKGYKIVNGTSAQFLKADGSIDSNSYATQSWVTSQGYITNSALSGYATENFVNTSISNLVDSSPATLDTLNELAAALGDDPNFATTMTNLIGTKENAFSKNTAFNKDFGTTAGTVAQGNDSRITNGQTAYDSINNGLVHRVNYSFGLNNTSNSHTNKSWFDYDWAGEGYAGSVINFSGLNGNYSTELFSAYAYPDSIGIRSKNGDVNSWNPVKWLWHSGNFNPASFITSSSLNSTLSNYVTVNGVQDISATKTFTVSPIVPNPTLANHAVNKSWVEGQGYINAGLNIDVSAESNNLRINPIEIFIDGSGDKEFDGSQYPHRLVYIILGDAADSLDLFNLQPKQRIVIFNITGNTISIKEDIASSTYSLPSERKVSVYKIQNSYYSSNSAIFYDMTGLAIW